MEGENNDQKIEPNKDKFGKVIDALHNKSMLSSLRTYHGDMAEFIKEKNESVLSIAVKEKIRKEEMEKKIEPQYKSPGKSQQNFQINLTMVILSLLLVGGGLLTFLYLFGLKNEPSSQVVGQTEIIPYNNIITLTNIMDTNLGAELFKLSPETGVSLVKLSDSNGAIIKNTKELFDFLKISPPAVLERTIKNDYFLGIISQNNEISNFVVITVDDFGSAFSAMLEWEENMGKDLAFLNRTTGSSTPAFFSWEDLIIKNKDSRALVDDRENTKLAYTFLNKNTILITNNLSAIGQISTLYASRAVAR